MFHHNSLLFAPPVEDYVYVDPSCSVFPSSEVLLDGSWAAATSSCGSEVLGYLDSDPVEVIYDSMSMMEDDDELLSPIFPDKGQEWTEATMVGLGVSELDDEQYQPLSSSSSPMTMHVEQHPIDSFHQRLDNSPIEGFHGDIYYSTSLDVAAAATNQDVMNVMMGLEMFGDQSELKFKKGGFIVMTD